MKHLSSKTLILGALAFALVGCGVAPVGGELQGQSANMGAIEAQRHHGGGGLKPAPNPAPPNGFPTPAPQKGGGSKGLTFVTIHATVTQILPEDTQGLPHQNFIVRETQGNEVGQTMTVNNDEQYGQKVVGLAVGEALVIRGVTYGGSHVSGIHWTHHDMNTNDAGFIQTPDGHVYQ